MRNERQHLADEFIGLLLRCEAVAENVDEHLVASSVFFDDFLYIGTQVKQQFVEGCKKLPCTLLLPLLFLNFFTETLFLVFLWNVVETVDRMKHIFRQGIVET